MRTSAAYTHPRSVQCLANALPPDSVCAPLPYVSPFFLTRTPVPPPCAVPSRTFSLVLCAAPLPLPSPFRWVKASPRTRTPCAPTTTHYPSPSRSGPRACTLPFVFVFGPSASNCPHFEDARPASNAPKVRGRVVTCPPRSIYRHAAHFPARSMSSPVAAPSSLCWSPDYALCARPPPCASPQRSVHDSTAHFPNHSIRCPLSAPFNRYRHACLCAAPWPHTSAFPRALQR